MVSRHIGGVAALHKQRNPWRHAENIACRLADRSTEGVLSCLGPGSPNRLLNTGGF
ncbi:hypothetical protein ACFVYE_36155 [Streptomyces sp. NPDC058239]|uniref:hypothetical protein n=1 Tax=unclassified Streptomyces TaxID=2593676 RepID=UPI003666CD9A